MFWNIPEAYIRTILVVLHSKCVTWWNVLDSFIACKSAWLRSLEISRSLYLQQLLITNKLLFTERILFLYSLLSGGYKTTITWFKLHSESDIRSPILANKRDFTMLETAVTTCYMLKNCSKTSRRGDSDDRLNCSQASNKSVVRFPFTLKKIRTKYLT